MSLQLALAGVLAIAGIASLAIAVRHERRMHAHRNEGVSYWAATWRRDGGWRRTDLFTSDGLAAQKLASRWGVAGALLLVGALIAWVALGAR